MNYAKSSGAHLFPFVFVGWQRHEVNIEIYEMVTVFIFIRANTALKIHSEVQHGLSKRRLSEENLMLLIMEQKCSD